MKRFALLITVMSLILVVTTGYAQDTTLQGGITVSGEVVVSQKINFENLDLAHCSMDEFRQWCDQFNAKQVAAAKVRHEEYLKSRGLLPSKTLSGSAGYTNGGLYPSNSSVFPLVAPGQGNTSSNFQIDSYLYEQRFPDMNDTGGGPITIINPYCLDYWRTANEHGCRNP